MQEEQKEIGETNNVFVGDEVATVASDVLTPTEVSTEVLDILPSTEVNEEEK